MAALVASPPTTGRCSNPVGGDREAVRQAQAAGAADAGQHVAQRGEVGLVQAALVYPAHAARRDGHARGGAEHARVEGLARLLGVLLRVVQRGERAQVAQGQALVVEQHRGGDERAGEAAAARLVGARHEAGAEGAVEAEEARAGRAAALRPACGAGTAAGGPSAADALAPRDLDLLLDLGDRHPGLGDPDLTGHQLDLHRRGGRRNAGQLRVRGARCASAASRWRRRRR